MIGSNFHAFPKAGGQFSAPEIQGYSAANRQFSPRESSISVSLKRSSGNKSRRQRKNQKLRKIYGGPSRDTAKKLPGNKFTSAIGSHTLVRLVIRKTKPQPGTQKAREKRSQRRPAFFLINKKRGPVLETNRANGYIRGGGIGGDCCREAFRLPPRSTPRKS